MGNSINRMTKNGFIVAGRDGSIDIGDDGRIVMVMDEEAYDQITADVHSDVGPLNEDDGVIFEEDSGFGEHKFTVIGKRTLD